MKVHFHLHFDYFDKGPDLDRKTCRLRYWRIHTLLCDLGNDPIFPEFLREKLQDEYFKLLCLKRNCPYWKFSTFFRILSTRLDSVLLVYVVDPLNHHSSHTDSPPSLYDSETPNIILMFWGIVCLPLRGAFYTASMVGPSSLRRTPPPHVYGVKFWPDRRHDAHVVSTDSMIHTPVCLWRHLLDTMRVFFLSIDFRDPCLYHKI